MVPNYPIEPVLHPVPLASLRPTQMTVGMIEVERKRREWRHRAKESGAEFLGNHMIPVVIGPKRVPWLIDHHHLALALLEEGVEHVLVTIVARLDDLPHSRFVSFMGNRNWLHPYDAEGRRHDFDALPKSLKRLADDPWRSLAGELRRKGGYAKSDAPYTEFLWADFLRRRIAGKLIRRDFDRALDKALHHARTRDASYLPGFSGPDE